MVKIAPSILSANFANLEQEIKALEQAGADMIHIDVMDGHFVPNITIGPDVIKSIRPHSNLPFDVHLMISNPEYFVKIFAENGADLITVHYEGNMHIDKIVSQIKYLGKKAGISLLPSTSPDVLDYVIDKLDLILVMSVNPGFGGQKFIESQIKKIELLSNKVKASKQDILISVDGGINKNTAYSCINAGANMLVAGSFIFKDKNYEHNIKSLKQKLV